MSPPPQGRSPLVTAARMASLGFADRPACPTEQARRLGAEGVAYGGPMLDHVAIQVADVDASARFYLAAFAGLGVHEVMRFPIDQGLVVGLGGADGFPRFWLGPLVDAGQREVHVAFTAASRDVVDRVHADAVAAGAEDPARSARVARIPPGLLRRVHPRSGRQQRGGGLPRGRPSLKARAAGLRSTQGGRGRAASPGKSCRSYP